MSVLQDPFGRQFPYLRLSITDVCNFSCDYCLPNGYQGHDREFLSVYEIHRLLTAFSELGVRKIRITGGEPTVRKDFLEIINHVTNLPGIENVGITTNGYRIEHLAENLLDSGIKSINISVDSLNPQVFYKVTGHDKLAKILGGINKLQQIGFPKIKVNVVLLKGINDQEVDQFLMWAKEKPLTIRFLELMQTKTNTVYFRKYYMNLDHIQDRLINHEWKKISQPKDAGPAIEYEHTNYRGKIGFIAPYKKNFCMSCNKLRVSARGDLFLCLFADKYYPLRELLQNDSQKEELKQVIQDKLNYKENSHFLDQGITGINTDFALLGG